MTVQLIQFCHSLQLLQNFFQNIALKGYLTQRWMAVTVSILQKKFLTKCRPKTTKKCQIFTLIYHWNFPKGGAYDVSGEVQKFSGEVQNDLRGGAHLPSKSGYDLYNSWLVPKRNALYPCLYSAKPHLGRLSHVMLIDELQISFALFCRENSSNDIISSNSDDENSGILLHIIIICTLSCAYWVWDHWWLLNVSSCYRHVSLFMNTHPNPYPDQWAPYINLVPRAFCFRSAKMALASAGHMTSKSPIFGVFNYGNLCV
jgi:hypothetical protein